MKIRKQEINLLDSIFHEAGALSSALLQRKLKITYKKAHNMIQNWMEHKKNLEDKNVD